MQKSPQWEINCSTVSMTLSEFIQHVDLHKDDKKWYYFDYKYMKQWFKSKPEIINSLNWKIFGIDKSGDDSTIWIGSKGAHTNCHQDSYGCNLVAQIHGRKQWLLFPPSATNFLQPTRIPYEESTVYSKYNFFCPTKEDEIKILKIDEASRLVTLEPGDVLFVPPGWWHYVESLDLSVSVNIWMPITADHVSRVKEAVVKLIVARIGENVYKESSEADCTLSDCMNLLDIAIKKCENIKHEESSLKKLKRTMWTVKDLATEYPNYVKQLHEVRKADLETFLRLNRERFSEELLKDNFIITDTDIDDYSSGRQLSENIVNALCHPDIINKVTESLLSYYYASIFNLIF